jgi:xylulokinase
VLDCTIEQVADPVHANLRGAALLAGLALGVVDRSEIATLVPVAAVHRPDPAARAVYDRMFAEFPRLHRAQRRMFVRLNRG